MISLGSGDIMEQANELLTDNILFIEREAFKGMEEYRICDNSSVERMDISGSKKCSNVCMFFTKVDNP